MKIRYGNWKNIFLDKQDYNRVIVQNCSQFFLQIFVITSF